MVSLYKEYKILSNKSGSYSNMNSLSDTIIPVINGKSNRMTSSKKVSYQRNRGNNLDF
jgi:hypothetical protein